MVTVDEIIGALQKVQAAGKGGAPVVVIHWLGGYEPAGLPEEVGVRLDKLYGADSGSLSDANGKPGDFEAVLIPFGEID